MNIADKLKAIENDIKILDEILKVYEEEARLQEQLEEDEKVALALVEKGDLDGAVAYTNHLLKEMSVDLKIEFADEK